MACSYYVRKDRWYYPQIKWMLDWSGFEAFFLCPASLCLHFCQWCPHSCTWPISHDLFRLHLVTFLALPTHTPFSHCSLARNHSPHSQNALLSLMALDCLSRLRYSFSSSRTYDLNDRKSRLKEKGNNGKRSSRKKRKTKKERVQFSDSQLYHTTLELMGNEPPFSTSDPFASTCTQFSQMKSGDVQRMGAVSKDKMWEGLIWHT